MVNSPLFLIRRRSKLLQSRSNQRFDSGGRPLDLSEETLLGIFHWQQQEVAIASSHPFRRKPPKFSSQGGDVPMLHRSEEHTSELQSRFDLVCRLLLEKKKKNNIKLTYLKVAY